MKLGLLTFNMAKDWDLNTILEKVPALGFDGVELRTQREHAHGVEPELSDDALVAIRERFVSAGVAIAGLSSSCSFDSPDPKVLRENIDATKRHLDMCALLGTDGVKVYGNVFHDEVPREQTIAQVAAALAECADHGAQVGAKVRFEMHGHFNTPELCLQVVGDADPAGIGLIFNCNPIDVADGSVERTWNAVRERVIHVHLHDLADPQFPYDELVRLLVRDGFEGWATGELPESADAERVLRYFVALWEAYVALAQAPGPRR
ncbi:MAG: sugar phosphate isomerase/epimerase family protein [Armatimonadota bacterium]